MESTKKIFIIFIYSFITVGIVLMGLRGIICLKCLLKGIEVRTPFPEFTTSDIYSSKYQKQFDSWTTENIGYRELFIQFDNQLNFSLFNEISSKNSSIILGLNNNLIEKSYLNTFNKIDRKPLVELEEQVKDLLKLQTFLSQRNITLLFLITPSKPSIYPEIIPDKLIITKNIPLKSNYELVRPLLDKYSINYIDGHEFTMNLKKNSKHQLFAKSGTHWNYYTAFLFTQELIKRIEKMSGKKCITIKSKKVIQTSTPKGSDNDLASLSNILFQQISVHDEIYYYPDIYSIKDKNIYRPKVLYIGGSFLISILGYLDVYKFHEEYDFYWYNSRKAKYNDNTIYGGLNLEKNKINKNIYNWEKEVFTKNIIVIESNENVISNIGFGFIQEALKSFKIN